MPTRDVLASSGATRIGSRLSKSRAHARRAKQASAAIGTTARQHAEDVHDTGRRVAREPDPPLAHPKAPLIGGAQPDYVADWRVSCEAFEGGDDSALHGSIEPLEVSPRTRREDEAAGF